MVGLGPFYTEPTSPPYSEMKGGKLDFGPEASSRLLNGMSLDAVAHADEGGRLRNIAGAGEMSDSAALDLAGNFGARTNTDYKTEQNVTVPILSAVENFVKDQVHKKKYMASNNQRKPQNAPTLAGGPGVSPKPSGPLG